MGTTDVGICNGALLRLGAMATIASLADNTPAARACSLSYASIRDEVLRAKEWTEAVKRAALAQLADAPAWGFAHQFQLPTDCLRVIGVERDEYTYRVEGDRLLTDQTTVNIKYIARIGEEKFGPDLVDCLKERLAAEIAFAVTGNRTKEEYHAGRYPTKLLAAGGANAMSGGTPEVIEADEWIEAGY